MAVKLNRLIKDGETGQEIKLNNEVIMPYEINLAQLKAKSTKKLEGELNFPETDPEVLSLLRLGFTKRVVTEALKQGRTHNEAVAWIYKNSDTVEQIYSGNLIANLEISIFIFFVITLILKNQDICRRVSPRRLYLTSWTVCGMG